MDVCGTCSHDKSAHYAYGRGPCGYRIDTEDGSTWRCPCERFRSLGARRRGNRCARKRGAFGGPSRTTRWATSSMRSKGTPPAHGTKAKTSVGIRVLVLLAFVGMLGTLEGLLPVVPR